MLYIPTLALRYLYIKVQGGLIALALVCPK